jgi:hypothetical protein
MKGEVEKVWKNETSDGRKYEVFQIGGQRYSLWEEEYLDKIQEGQPLEFDFRESGDFKNISKIYGAETGAKQPEGEEKTPKYDDGRNKRIVRMSCLRSAAGVLTESTIPCEKRPEILGQDEKDLSEQSDLGLLARPGLGPPLLLGLRRLRGDVRVPGDGRMRRPAHTKDDPGRQVSEERPSRCRREQKGKRKGERIDKEKNICAREEFCLDKR